MSNLCFNEVSNDVMNDAKSRFVFPNISVVFSIKNIDVKHKEALNDYLMNALNDDFNQHTEGGLYLSVYKNAIISIRYETTDMTECDDDFLIAIRDFTNEKLNEFVTLNGGYDAIKVIQ